MYVYADSWADAYNLSRELAKKYKSRQYQDVVETEAPKSVILNAIDRLGIIARVGVRHPSVSKADRKRSAAAGKYYRGRS